MQIWGSVAKCQHYRFLDIFWDILDKRKGNLGKEFVKREFPSFLGKIGKIVPDFPGKNNSFFSIGLTFSIRPSLKSGVPNNKKVYMFGMSKDRVIRCKSFIKLSFIWIQWPFEYWYFWQKPVNFLDLTHLL